MPKQHTSWPKKLTNFVKIIAFPDYRELRKLKKQMLAVLNLYNKYHSMSPAELKQMTAKFKEILRANEANGLDLIITDALAVAREAGYRATGMLAFPVQIMGALAVIHGNFAEMKTGEGKTLTLVLAAYVKALEEKGVHIITVNQYLVERDCAFANQILSLLDMEAKFNCDNSDAHPFTTIDKQKAYGADITYTTNSEVGFDYLRDNSTATNLADKVLVQGLHFCIVDEGDSVMLDDAKTPLILAAEDQNANLEEFSLVEDAVQQLDPADYETDDEAQTAFLTPTGYEKLEHILNIDLSKDVYWNQLVNNALRANFVFKAGKQYVMDDDTIKIVDASTGRILEGRTYSNGLHQALQAHEHIKVDAPNLTIASITYQSFFVLYDQISAVSGTAWDSKDELLKTYNLLVVRIPTNKPVIRVDHNDVLVETAVDKWPLIIQDIQNKYEMGQPVLVGTGNVAESEFLSQALSNLKIPHQLLNAKNGIEKKADVQRDRTEAEIVAMAGQKHAVTITTNMAGRGTDIKLGPGVKELGGLYVIGTERNESHRIDMQLAGRAGRQGDPGESQFYLSFDDPLFVQNNADYQEQTKAKFEKVGQELAVGKIYRSSFMLRIVKKVQKAAEGRAYAIRDDGLQYERFIAHLRDMLYAQRDSILKKQDLDGIVHRVFYQMSCECVRRFKNNDFIETVDLIEMLNKSCLQKHPLEMTIFNNDHSQSAIINHLTQIFDDLYLQKKLQNNDAQFTDNIKDIFIHFIDKGWTSVLAVTTSEKNQAQLRQLEQLDPVHLFVQAMTKVFDEFKLTSAFNIGFAILMLDAQDMSVQTQEQANVVDGVEQTVKKFIANTGQNLTTKAVSQSDNQALINFENIDNDADLSHTMALQVPNNVDFDTANTNEIRDQLNLDQQNDFSMRFVPDTQFYTDPVQNNTEQMTKQGKSKYELAMILLQQEQQGR